MALVQIASPGGVDPRTRQMLAAQLLGGSVSQFGQLRQQQLERQALAEMLGGRAAEVPTAAQLDPTKMTVGSQAGTLAAPATPGIVPGLTPEQAQSYVAAGAGPALLQTGLERAYPGPVNPVAVREGGALVDPRTGQVVYQDQAAPEPPKMRDRLEGGQRIFEQFNPATSQWDRLSSGPAFAPPAQTNITNVPAGAVLPQAQAPRQIGSVSDVGRALIDPETGELNMQTLAAFNVPGYGGPIPGTRGAQLRSAYDEAVNTLIYLQTGKAATDEERAAANRIYLPGPLDSPPEVRDKLGRLQSSLTSFLEVSARGQPGATQPPPTPPIPQASEQPGLIEQGMQAIQGMLGGGQQPPAAGQAVGPDELGEGEIIRNDQTGERFIVRGGQLVPYGG
jgi:hypothetical protein